MSTVDHNFSLPQNIRFCSYMVVCQDYIQHTILFPIGIHEKARKVQTDLSMVKSDTDGAEICFTL